MPTIDASQRGCTFPDCSKPHRAKGYCAGHYMQYTTGKPLKELQVRKPRPVCKFEGCDKSYLARGYCSGHYYQWSMGYELRELTRQRKSDGTWAERARYALDQNIEIVGDCHIWTKTKDRFGYGRIWFENERWLVHRLAYTVKMDDKDACGSHSVHHTCAQSSCLNPDHLQLVTHYDNMAEMLERQGYLKEIDSLKKKIRDLESVNTGRLTKMERYVICNRY